MKLRNFLLGASLAFCGAALGQESATKLYIVDANVTLTADHIEVWQDEDLNTTFTLGENVQQEPGDLGGCNKPYLGNVNGVVGTWNSNSTIICNFVSPRQCIWTN